MEHVMFLRDQKQSGCGLLSVCPMYDWVV